MTSPPASVTTAPTGTDPFCAERHAQSNAVRQGGSSAAKASRAAVTTSARLEELDDVARRILDEDLRAARALDDVVSEAHARGAEARDLTSDVVDDDLKAIPSAGRRLSSIRHRMSR